MAANRRYATMGKINPAVLKEKINKYFDGVDRAEPYTVYQGKNMFLRKPPYTVSGLARALGITTSTLGRYLREEVEFDCNSEGQAKECLALLVDARMRIEDHLFTRGLVGDLEQNVVKSQIQMLGGDRCIDAPDEQNSKVITITVTGTDAQVSDWSK